MSNGQSIQMPIIVNAVNPSRPIFLNVQVGSNDISIVNKPYENPDRFDVSTVYTMPDNTITTLKEYGFDIHKYFMIDLEHNELTFVSESEKNLFEQL